MSRGSPPPGGCAEVPVFEQHGSLRLSEQQPFAHGRERLVFRHPHIPFVAVKVIRPEHSDLKRESAGLFRRHSRQQHYTVFLRELGEYLALRARAPHGGLPLPMIMGLVETDMGLGLVTELLEMASGKMAPTLRQLLSAGADPAALQAPLKDFEQALLAYEVVVNDVSLDNIMATGAHQASRLVLVDGFGDKNLIPLRSLSRRANAFNTRRRFLRLQREIQQFTLDADQAWNVP